MKSLTDLQHLHLRLIEATEAIAFVERAKQDEGPCFATTLEAITDDLSSLLYCRTSQQIERSERA